MVEQYIVFKTSGSIKEHTQTSTDMGIGSQRNGHRLRPIICQVVALCSQSRSCRLRQGGMPEGAVYQLG